MKNKNWILCFITILCSLTIGFLVSVVNGWGGSEQTESDISENGLPKIEIRLNNLSLDELNNNKFVKYNGNDVSIIDEYGRTDYSDIEIRPRGNSTWSMPKKPYQLKFPEKVELLSLGRAKKWILLANYIDTSQMRNDIAMYLAYMLDDAFPLKGDFIELKINDEDLGMYYLVRKATISKDTIDLRDRMGVLVELENLRTYEHECYWTINNECLTTKDAVDNDHTDAAMIEFKNAFDKLEIAAMQKDYQTVSEIADIASFVEYFLINEFAVNPDAYSSSFYMYKDGTDDKIHAGPVWDFDYAFGNRKWEWAANEEFFSPDNYLFREVEARGGILEKNGEIVSLQSDWVISKLFYDLMKIPEFETEVKKVYSERLSGREEELMRHIDMKTNQILQALRADSEKWGIDNAEEELRYLKDWVRRRYRHFEARYGHNYGPGSAALDLV